MPDLSIKGTGGYYENRDAFEVALYKKQWTVCGSPPGSVRL